jgi:hypothetical protein
MTVSFRTWVLKEGQNRFNLKMRQLADQILRDACSQGKGNSYEHLVVHMLNEHNCSMEEADLLYWAGLEWASATGHKGLIEHPYELS